MNTPLVQEPLALLALLLALLALLFVAARHRLGARFFRVVPLLLLAYFLPALLSNTGVIPFTSPLYQFVKAQVLPASLLLLVMVVDVPAIVGLGRQALGLFLTATASIVLGGPLAYLALGWTVPAALGEQTWKGLAALAGSWIGGAANFIAIGESVGAEAGTISMMVVVDVAVANVWMAVLLYFSGRERKMDARINADRQRLDRLRQQCETFRARVAHPTTLHELMTMLALAVGSTVLAHALASQLPAIGSIVREFTWVVLIVTTIGLGLSFTRLRELEGAGASEIGGALLYLLVATIGAQAEFRRLLEAPALVGVGALWMAIHALLVLLVRRWWRVPIFFAAVGSQANVGGAASAPIVAAAFHPALAPAGILLAVGGYVLGTYAGLLCAVLLQWVHGAL